MRIRNKRKVWLSAALLTVMLCITASPLTAFTGGGPEYEETLPEEQTEETTGGYELQPLTPEDNMSLADDIQSEAPGSRQFITVVTKDGNYFYIIIDRVKDEENTVHFLNQVDEVGLLDSMDEEMKPWEPIIIPELEPTPKPGPKPEPEKSGAGDILVVTLVLTPGGDDTFYYSEIMKPKQSIKGDSDLDDFDFEDDKDEETGFEDEQKDMG